MRKQFLPYLVIGLLLVAVAIGLVLYGNRGSRLELEGAVLKVRTQAMDEASSVAVIDFRFVNSSNYLFVVRTVDVSVEDSQGNTVEARTVSERDARQLFRYYPLLGQKFNDSLVIQARIRPHQSLDRMVTARFEIPEQQLQARRKLRIRIEDVDGAVSELVE